MPPSEHDRDELAAFAAFVAIAELDVTDFRKLKPPQPDIGAQVGDEQWAFELTQAVDRQAMWRQGKMIMTQQLLDQLKRNLSPEELDRLLGRSGSMSIAIDFVPASAPKQRVMGAQAVLEYLYCHPDGEGELILPDCTFVESVRIYRTPDSTLRRVGLVGPSTGYVRVPIKERILKKLETSYRVDGFDQVHLLLFAWINLMLPPELWEEDVNTLLYERLRESPFDKVWIVDLNGNEILYQFRENV